MSQIKTISELIEALEAIREAVGDDARLLGAYQPNYPLVGSVDNVGVVDGTVYIALGASPYDVNPYAPSAAWDEPEC